MRGTCRFQDQLLLVELQITAYETSITKRSIVYSLLFLKKINKGVWSLSFRHQFSSGYSFFMLFSSSAAWWIPWDVDLPYNYKPIKNLYDSGILETDRACAGKNHEKQVPAHVQPMRETAAFQVISHSGYIAASQAADCTVHPAPECTVHHRDPVSYEHLTQMIPVRRGCCCGSESHVIKHISVPVIMTCGQPSALPRCKLSSSDGQAYA